MAIPTVGSGLDIPQLVSSLVNASRKPTADRINAAGNTATAKLSAFSQIKQSLNSLKTSLQTVTDRSQTPVLATTISGGDAGFSASASASAVPGHYSVEVVQLASAHKLASAGHVAKTHPGAGSLSIKVGDNSFKVDIAADASLPDIAKAINTATGSKSVLASVVTADDGQHLVLAGTEPGLAHQISVSATGADGLKALATGFKTQTKAQDSIVKIDGLTRSFSGNSVTDLLPGVTLTLSRAEVGKEFTLDVKADNSALKSALNEFAKAWNSSNTVLKNSSAYQPESRRGSILTGDSLVRGLQQQLRGQVSDDLTALKAVGVSLDKDGKMQVDGAAFDKAMAEDPAAVKRVFGREGHYNKAVGAMLDSHLNAVDGSLTTRHKSLDKQIKGYESQLDALDARMQKLSALYTKQFVAMERMIAQMQGSSSALDSLLKNTASKQ